MDNDETTEPKFFYAHKYGVIEDGHGTNSLRIYPFDSLPSAINFYCGMGNDHPECDFALVSILEYKKATKENTCND